MEQSSSYDETKIRYQFNRKCKLALDGEVVDYNRYLKYRSKHEIMFSEMSVKQLNDLSEDDNYDEDICFLKVCEYDVKIKDTLLAEAIKTLTKRKQDVILLSYFLEMNDAEIARKLNLVRSTVNEHRKRSLEILRQVIEEYVHKYE